MLETDPEWFRSEDDKILYWEEDITKQMASVRPSFWNPLKYYLTDKKKINQNKVVFQGSAYAFYRDGKITAIKFL